MGMALYDPAVVAPASLYVPSAYSNTPQTPYWWLNRLHAKLASLQEPLRVLNDYYVGNHRLAIATGQYRKVFWRLLKGLADNWCGVVVDAVEERLTVQGFRIEQPNQTQPEDRGPGDQDAWEIWQRNNMDAGSQMAHLEAFIKGYANVLVWGDEDGKAVITPEDPTQSYVELVPGTIRKRAAAIKEWTDDWTGILNATVYLPQAIYKFRSEDVVKRAPSEDPSVKTNITWKPRTVAGETWPLRNPLGVVPMVPLENKARLLDRCDSEVRPVIPLQDACNKLVGDMMVSSEFQAFRQRWATGLEIPVDPETNRPVEPFKAAVDRLWVTEDPEVHFGEFEQADLRVFTNAIETLVQHIATQSRTPPHYFYLSGQFPSGESIKAAETGLVTKARRRMVPFGDTWEEVMRLAFGIENDPRANAINSETIWMDPESRSEAEHTDAMIKLKALNVPDESLWERWGFSPTEIERFKDQRAAAMEQAVVAAQKIEAARGVLGNQVPGLAAGGVAALGVPPPPAVPTPPGVPQPSPAPPTGGR